MTTRQTPTSPVAGTNLSRAEPLHLETETPAGQTPLTVVRRIVLRPDSPVLYGAFDAAHELGIHLLVQNRINEEGQVVLDVTAYADELAVEDGYLHEWWPMPPGWQDAERHGTDDEQDTFSDPRWVTHACRAMYVWVEPHRHGSADHGRFLTWIVDFSTVPLRNTSTSLRQSAAPSSTEKPKD